MQNFYLAFFVILSFAQSIQTHFEFQKLPKRIKMIEKLIYTYIFNLSRKFLNFVFSTTFCTTREQECGIFVILNFFQLRLHILRVRNFLFCLGGQWNYGLKVIIHLVIFYLLFFLREILTLINIWGPTSPWAGICLILFDFVEKQQSHISTSFGKGLCHFLINIFD